MIVARNLDFSHARTKREVFDRLFPTGAKITVANARRAAGAGLSLRCGAKQLMSKEHHTEFERHVHDLYSLYMENTADTRDAMQALDPYHQKMEWIEAKTVHSKNKKRHWSAYLDGLAKVFVEEMEPETA